MLDINYHGESGNEGTQLISTVHSAAPIRYGDAYMNGQLLGGTFTNLANLKKSSKWRFIEILHNVQEHGESRCHAIARQSGFTNRQLWMHMGDVFFFGHHPTPYQRKKLFEYLQKKYLDSAGRSVLWNTGW